MRVFLLSISYIKNTNPIFIYQNTYIVSTYTNIIWLYELLLRLHAWVSDPTNSVHVRRGGRVSFTY